MEVLDLGLKSYQETWELQKQILEMRADGTAGDTLILVEHHPVYTVGRAGMSTLRPDPDDPGDPGNPGNNDTLSVAQHAPSEIKVRKLGSVPVVEIERGGKLTFHGPGQLVGYPIFGLPHRDLRRYLRDLERVLMSVLAEETLLPARPCPETLYLEPGQLQTGVWVRDKKVASIGIAVKRWVAYHGFALNLTTDLRYFEAVEPCGFSGEIMTSLARELGADGNMPALTSKIKAALVARFTDLSKRYGAFAGEAVADKAIVPRDSERSPLLEM